MLAFNLNAWQGFPVFFLSILFSLAYQHHIIGKLIRSHTRWYFIEWWCDQKCVFSLDMWHIHIPFTKQYFWYHVLRAWYNPYSAMGSNMELNLCWMHDSVECMYSLKKRMVHIEVCIYVPKLSTKTMSTTV